jgi:hypothetical protein
MLAGLQAEVSLFVVMKVKLAEIIITIIAVPS